MKKIISVIAFALFFLGLFAQIQWQEQGISVRQGVNIEWSRAAAPVDDGYIIYVWSDTRRGDRDLWAQKIGEDGNMIWGENSNHPEYPTMKEGTLVNSEINRQEDPVVIDIGDGEVIIAWVDFRNEDTGDIYAQKLNSDGEVQWEEEGVPLCLAEDVQISLNIVNDTEGGAYIIWLDSRNPGGVDIYGTHILSSGEIAEGWIEDGNPIADFEGSQDQHTFWEDGYGGAILAWHDTRVPTDNNIYMQRITSDGTFLWDEEGELICDAPGTQENVKITPDIDGDFIFTWRDKRDDYNGDIYAQKIDVDGELLWTSEVVVYADTCIQQNPRITKSSDGGAFIVWEDGRYDYSFKEIFAQKLDTNGTLVWEADGKPICVEPNNQLNPRLVGDSNGGTVIIWDDGRVQGHPHEDIYIQHVNSDGSINYPENGELICDAFSEQFSPLIKKNSNDYLFLNWGDNRTGSTGMYIQIINNTGTELLEDSGEIIYYGLCGDALDYKLLSNGDNAILFWIDTRESSIANQIYMQILNNDGTFGLDDDGKTITNMTGFSQENFDVVYKQGSDIIGLVWEEIRIGERQIFAQGVDLDGDSIWSDDIGIGVCDETDSQEFPGISVKYEDGNYMYYVGWSDNRDWMTGYGIYGQKITSEGELLWGSSGILIVDNGGDDILNDIVENFYIWHGGDWPVQDLFVKLVNEDGSTAPGWPDEGLLLCGADGFQENAKGLIVPEGLLVVWEDRRNGASDLYGQIIDHDANFLWETDGIPLASAYCDTLHTDQKTADFLYDENLFMVWEDFRSGIDEDIFIQKYDSDGEELWSENGNEIAIKDSAQTSPCLVKNGEEFIVFWQDHLSASGTDLYAQLINSDGDQMWDAGGEVICDAIKRQNKPASVPTGDNMAFVIWQDTRSSGKTDIYNIDAQKVEMDNDETDHDILPSVNIKLKQNFPNPFNPLSAGRSSGTTISFDIPNGIQEEFKLKIYNIKGQLVKSFKPETNFVVWDGKNLNGKSVSNGLYFYRLESKNYESKAKKMILLK